MSEEKHDTPSGKHPEEHYGNDGFEIMKRVRREFYPPALTEEQALECYYHCKAFSQRFPHHMFMETLTPLLKKIEG